MVEYKVTSEIKNFEAVEWDDSCSYPVPKCKRGAVGLTVRLGTTVTGLSVPNAKWVEVAKQESYLFYFLFFFPSFLHFISTFYLSFSLNFYCVLTHLAPSGSNGDWKPKTWESSCWWSLRAFTIFWENNSLTGLSLLHLHVHCGRKLLLLLQGKAVFM
jgi:hypothetical protein